jgi:regulator of RNase E activity RraA
MFAELVSLAAREKGLAGVVVDGPVRDSDALSKDHSRSGAAARTRAAC